MSFDRIAFQYYDPYTDKKLWAAKGDEVWQYPEIPGGYYDTIRRTKQLIKTLSLEELGSMLPLIEQYTQLGLFMGCKNPNPIYADTTYKPAGSADVLFSYFEYGDHDISLEQRAQLFGVLAAAINGTIYNAMWPGPDVIRANEGLRKMMEQAGLLTESENDQSPDFIELILDATKAVLYGEQYALRASYGKDKSMAEQNSINARRSGKHKKELLELWVEWASKLPAPNSYSSALVAQSYFITNVLPEHLQPYISDGTGRSMNKKLNKAITSSGQPHPFKAKS